MGLSNALPSGSPTLGHIEKPGSPQVMGRLCSAVVNQDHNGSTHITSLQPFPTPQKEKSHTPYVHLNTELHIKPTGPLHGLREHTKVKATQLLGSQESLEARERNLAVLKALCKSHTTTPQDKRNISTHTDTEPSKGWEEHAGGCSITQTLPMEQGVLLTMKDSI